MPKSSKRNTKSASLDLNPSTILDQECGGTASHGLFVKGVTVDHSSTDPLDTVDSERIPLLKIDECVSEQPVIKDKTSLLPSGRRGDCLKVNHQPQISKLEFDIVGESKDSLFPWQRNIAVQV